MNEKMLRAKVVLEGKKISDLINCLKITKCTFYRKLKRNGDFNRDEIEKIINFLSLEESETKEIFFNDEVS